MNKGNYVLATKYSDGDILDGWGVGFFDSMLPKYGGDRYMVTDNDGSQLRGNGFRRCELISPEEGDYLIDFCKEYEADRMRWQEIYNLWDVLASFRQSNSLRVPEIEEPATKDGFGC